MSGGDASRAAEAVPVIARALDLRVEGDLHGSPLSPNALRLVRTSEDELAVLKVVPGLVAGEIEALKSWTSAGVPCPAVLSHGRGTIVTGVTHLLLSHVSGTPVTHLDMPDWTPTVVAAVSRGHIDAPPTAVLLADFLRPRVARFLAVWKANDLPTLGDVETVLAGMGPGDRLLHGDLVGLNLLTTSSRAVTFIDPVGLRGPAEFDAGRWIGRCHVSLGAAGLQDLIHAAPLADPSLDDRLLGRCVGVELVIEVAHRTTQPAIFLNLGATPLGFAARTADLAELAVDLLSK